LTCASNGSNNIENIHAICVQCHFSKTKNEQENGDYFHLPEYASTFNDRVQKVIFSQTFKRYAFVERIEKKAKRHQIFNIDINKCRRNIVLFLKQNNIEIPVFTCMDDIEEYRQSDSVKPGFYFVESKNYFPLRNNGWYSHAMIMYCLDNNILTHDDIKLQLIASLTVPGDYFNDAIQALMNLPNSASKMGPNVFIGLFNHTQTSFDKTYFFQSFNQASLFYASQKAQSRDILIKQLNANQKYFCVSSSSTKKSDYYVNIMYHLIMDCEAIELHKLKNIIEKNNGHVSLLNTDCCECWFNGDKQMDLSPYFWDNNKTIPKYKYETKDINSTDVERMKQYVHAETARSMDFYFVKEWKEILDPGVMDLTNSGIVEQIIDSNQSYHLDGIAGAGKTTLLKKIISTLREQHKKFFILCPTNAACRQIDPHAITLHKFCGRTLQTSNSMYTTLRDCEYIIVDEISMMREIFYYILSVMKKMNPKIKLILAGDIQRQLPPVCDRDDYDYYNSQILYELCNKNRILLTKCRRSDKQLFEVSLNHKINNYPIGKTEHDVNICFTNEKRKEINFKWMKKYRPILCLKTKKLEYDPNSQDMVIYKGLPLISRINNAKYDIVNNERFIVQSVNSKTKMITIGYDIEENSDSIQIPLDDVNKLFYPAYCVTVHRSQGVTINKPYTIHEWSKFNWKLKYVSLTRATSIHNINIIQ